MFNKVHICLKLACNLNLNFIQFHNSSFYTWIRHTISSNQACLLFKGFLTASLENDTDNLHIVFSSFTNIIFHCKWCEMKRTNPFFKADEMVRDCMSNYLRRWWYECIIAFHLHIWLWECGCINRYVFLLTPWGKLYCNSCQST